MRLTLFLFLITAVIFSGCSKKETTTTTTITIINETKEKASSPSFSPVGGSYDKEQNVFLSTETEGAKIRYTVDGSEPNELSNLYRGIPVKVSSSLTLKAIAMKDGFDPSSVSSADYTINKTENLKEEVKEEIKEEIKGVKNVEGKKYFVRWGDNLWNICKKEYGDPWFYPALFEANPKLRSPRKILAGTYLIIPNKSDLKRWDFSK
ncbi:MAG TPA: chitobiase/beta-hexosaminidase C-terminal domain-containing protein [Spirochaetota bacterium]|nr:chitobiase/beta-hexosaminidase C-terminal domain-containing protein [Spirochaetota bacterium]